MKRKAIPTPTAMARKKSTVSGVFPTNDIPGNALPLFTPVPELVLAPELVAEAVLDVSVLDMINRVFLRLITINLVSYSFVLFSCLLPLKYQMYKLGKMLRSKFKAQTDEILFSLAGPTAGMKNEKRERNTKTPQSLISSSMRL